MNEYRNRQTYSQADRRTKRQVYRITDGLTHIGMEGPTDGHMKRWTDRQTNVEIIGRM